MRPVPFSCLSLLLAVQLAAPSLASSLNLAVAADTPSTANIQTDLSKAKSLIESGEFERAVGVLEGLAELVMGSDTKAQVLHLLGVAQLSLGEEDAARSSFEKLLMLEPDYELPRSTAPKILQLFAKIKESIKTKRVPLPKLRVGTIPDVKAGQSYTLEATLEDLSLGLKAKLHYRRYGTNVYNAIDFEPVAGSNKKFVATLPGYDVPRETRPYRVDYYVEIADAAQRRLGGRGTADEPLGFEVLHELPNRNAVTKPWYKKPWVWIVGGALVAGAAAAVVVVVAQPKPATP